MDLYLMSPPHPAWALRGRANFKSEAAAQVDAGAARAEWLALADAIESLGAKVAVLPPDPELTGLPYAAEAGHPLPPARAGDRPRFLLPRMRVEHRKRELEHWKPFVERLGFEAIDIGAGTWEGQGDVATLGMHTFIFYGGRTDREGAEAAAAHFGEGVSLIALEPPAFHGNMAFLPIPHARVALVCADTVDHNSLALLEAKIGRDRLRFVTEEEMRAYATNALPIGKTLLAASSLPEQTRHVLEGLGLELRFLTMNELCDKAGGASRCLVCHVAHPPEGLVVPPELSLEAARAAIHSSAG